MSVPCPQCAVLVLVLTAAGLWVAAVDWEYDDKFDACISRCSQQYDACLARCKGRAPVVRSICKRRLQDCEMFCRLKHSHPVK